MAPVFAIQLRALAVQKIRGAMSNNKTIWHQIENIEPSVSLKIVYWPLAANDMKHASK